MEHRPGRKPLRPSDQLSSLIREALAERIGHAEPSPYGRQLLLARAREAQTKRPKRKLLLYPFVRVTNGRRFLTTVVSVDSARDPFLVMGFNAMMNPLISLMR